jgi:hypothetical protein
MWHPSRLLKTSATPPIEYTPIFVISQFNPVARKPRYTGYNLRRNAPPHKGWLHRRKCRRHTGFRVMANKR